MLKAAKIGKLLSALPAKTGSRVPNISIERFKSSHPGKASCMSLEETTKQGIACKRADLRRKPIPPYRYGYCREPDVPMMMSCPPKSKKRGKGPCCHEATDTKKGGCKIKK